MIRKMILKAMAASLALMLAFLFTAPTHAQVQGGGPYGDIDGYYTWEINGKGWTIYSQNGYSWVYDDYGNRTYLDSYGNKLNNVTAAAAKTITEMKLTYNSTSNGVDIYQNPDGKLYTVDASGRLYAYGSSPSPVINKNDLVVTYVYTSAEGINVYKDVNGSLWFFGEGYYPYRWYGSNAGSYWVAGIPNKVYRYAYPSADHHTIYTDDAGRQWWFDDAGAHPYSGHAGGLIPSDVDYSRSNTMWVDGTASVVHVGEYWTAPTTVSWSPAGMHLIGWDWAESTGYARWKPGDRIKNTGNDLALYAVYAY